MVCINMNGFNWLKFALFLFFFALLSIGLAITKNDYGVGIGLFGAGGLMYLITVIIINYLDNK